MSAPYIGKLKLKFHLTSLHGRGWFLEARGGAPHIITPYPLRNTTLIHRKLPAAKYTGNRLPLISYLKLKFCESEWRHPLGTRYRLAHGSNLTETPSETGILHIAISFNSVDVIFCQSLEQLLSCVGNVSPILVQALAA